MKPSLWKIKVIKWAIAVLGLLLLSASTDAASLKIATYNVNNLFDAADNGTEYPEYDPNGPYAWNRSMADIKATNIARVLTAMKADVVCLQEIESRQALDLLLNKLKINATPYPYAAIADKSATTVNCAVISTCPIIDQQELSPGENMRAILQVTVEFEHHPLILFVNHWKSKQGPESRRIIYARALKKAIARLDRNTDYIIAGDLNANYDEFITIRDEPRLDDTRGRTGINHVLGTILDNRLVTETDLTRPGRGARHYNLWLELPPDRRWSYVFFGRKNTPDSILLPRGLYDNKGIAYIDNSFDKFDPDFLFDGRGNIFRWQRADKGRGKHLGKGYSDHLPIFALFSTEPFQPRPTEKARK